MNESIIRSCNLTKSFGGRTVVDHLSFEVHPGAYGQIGGLLPVPGGIAVICTAIAVKTFRWE